MTDEHKKILKRICIEHPEYYLDEFADALLHQTGYLFASSTIHKMMDEIGYSLQVCYHAANQRNEDLREQYMTCLHSIVTDASQLIFIDETHKDRNASRCRRAYGQKNSGGIPIRLILQ